LARQIDELKARGFGGFFMHPRAGLLTPYGSREWFDVVGFCIDHAKKIGLEAWLYDEDPFPSGMAGGRVTLDHPEYRASHLRLAELPVHTPGEYELDLPAGALIGAFLVHDGNVSRVDDRAGLVRTDWDVWLQSTNYYPPFTAEGAPHWRASAANTHYRVVVDIHQTPATLIGFTRHYAEHRPWGEYADLMNPKAVDYFLELTHREYHRRFGSHFGTTVPGIFTDEPKVPAWMPWSEYLDVPFRALTGRALADSLPHLVLDVDKRTPFIRWAYREAVSQAFRAAYIVPVERYCRSVNLAFTGHISPEEDPIGQAYMTPGLMNWIGGMTVPGTDHIGTEIGDARHPLLHLGPKLASSAAHTRGRTHVLCEAFAVADWVQDMAFMGKVTNWLYALGVNQLCTHGQFYSIDGPRKREAPPSQFIPAAYWEHFGALSRYVENLSRELTSGHHAAPLAVYYPSEAFMALATDPESRTQETAEPLRTLIAELCDRLLTAGYDFDLVDAQALVGADAVDARLRVKQEQYMALVLPGGWMREDAVAALRKLERAGVPILSLERQIPILGNGVYRPRRTTGLTTLVRRVAGLCQPIFKARGRLLGHKRAARNGFRLFLTNNGDTRFSGAVTPDFPGPYEIYDPQTGVSHAASSPPRLEMEPDRSVLIRQTKRIRPTGPVHRNASDWRPWMDLTTEWTARPESDNCLVLHEYRMVAGATPRHVSNVEFVSAPFVDVLAPDVRAASTVPGRIRSFWTSFDCHGYDRPLWLVRDSQLGPPADRACSDTFRFFVNGQPVPAFRRCRRYDPYNLQTRIDRLLCEGRNHLVIEQSLPTDWPVEQGMPYDAVRLFGDFHAEFPHGHSTPARLTPRPPSYPLGAPASPSHFGHPHYGGIVIHERSVELKTVPERLALRFERLYESAEILVNGVVAGTLWQPPHLLEIDRSLWQTGHNTLTIRCATSPASYLQALIRPAGFAAPVTCMSM